MVRSLQRSAPIVFPLSLNTSFPISWKGSRTVQSNQATSTTHDGRCVYWGLTYYQLTYLQSHAWHSQRIYFTQSWVSIYDSPSDRRLQQQRSNFVNSCFIPGLPQLQCYCLERERMHRYITYPSLPVAHHHLPPHSTCEKRTSHFSAATNARNSLDQFLNI